MSRLFGSRIASLVTVAVAIAVFAGCAATADPTPSTTRSHRIVARDEFSYKGRTGSTALELLASATDGNYEATGTGANTFVTSINGREAYKNEREFWALYVNGTESKVGAGSLQTTTGDEIEWKIETY